MTAVAHTTNGGYSSASEIRLGIPAPDGGVYFCGSSLFLPDGKCPDMMNMWPVGGVLKTRPGQSHPYGSFALPEFADGDETFTQTDVSAASESFHSAASRSFYGSAVYHCGKFILAFDGKSAPRVIYGNAPDCKSFFCEIGSMLYLYTSDEHLLSVDKGFAVKVCEPYVPTVMTDATTSLSSFKTNEDFNLLSRKITVEYVSFSNQRALRLPYPADTAAGFTLIRDGYKVTSASFDGEGFISIPGTLTGDKLVLTYTVKAESEVCRTGMIFGCTFAESYGGTTVEGTRIFLSGNPDFPGYYFRSELLNPFYFKSTAYDIIGNGNDRVTAFSKQYGGLIVFTERSIAKIVYAFDENGADFTVREINSRIGCDMPGSVALIDNRTVFANRSGGVYVIDTTDNSDEMNVVPISECILGDGARGLRSESEADSAACVSIDFGGKYFLFVSAHAYVWDYTATPYYSGISMREFGKRFAWYIFGKMGVSAVFGIGGELWFVKKCEVLPTLFSEKNRNDFGSPIVSYFRTKEYNGGFPALYKRAARAAFTLTSRGNAHVKLFVVCDGKRILAYPTAIGRFAWNTFGYGSFTWDAGCFKRRLLRTPANAGFRFAVGAECTDGVFGIADAEVIFIKQP